MSNNSKAKLLRLLPGSKIPLSASHSWKPIIHFLDDRRRVDLKIRSKSQSPLLTQLLQLLPSGRVWRTARCGWRCVMADAPWRHQDARRYTHISVTSVCVSGRRCRASVDSAICARTLRTSGTCRQLP